MFLVLRGTTFICYIIGSPWGQVGGVADDVIAELRRPEGPPSGAPYSSYRGKIKETHEFIFSWLSWLAVLLVGAYARRRRRSCPTWRPYSKKETYSLSLPCLRIHSAIASWIHSYFDNVMTKFMINNRTDA